MEKMMWRNPKYLSFNIGTAAIVYRSGVEEKNGKPCEPVFACPSPLHSGWENSFDNNQEEDIELFQIKQIKSSFLTYSSFMLFK